MDDITILEKAMEIIGEYSYLNEDDEIVPAYSTLIEDISNFMTEVGYYKTD